MRFAESRSGVAAVEFAIIAPVFVLLFMGMVAYAIYFGAMHSLQQLAADAARASIAGLDETERESIVTSFLDENADGYVFINRRKLQVEIGDTDAGTQFVVQLRYNAEDLPIWTLLEGLPLPGKTMSRRSTIRVGGI
ncbi:TadE/TadG family type IV pilus assembly protein [Chelativorans sp. AA-79]|uniref:TadE/TadG family type IV pilus assembly protein n=1 Tax=Chelativorans sp. AA-79 TaxID=3028735 RepID=UPI0023F66D86|nr:TadE/TadG family type IV pilus assembly protein [Chelativorans sp. AA-79]WEX11705.1 pilus assembly protein [Chelativorans sp. AA-79]